LADQIQAAAHNWLSNPRLAPFRSDATFFLSDYERFDIINKKETPLSCEKRGFVKSVHVSLLEFW